MPGECTTRRVVVDLTFSELLVAGVFIISIVLLTVYSLELGSAMLAFVTSKLILPSAARRPPELWPAPLRRVLSLRSRRWVVGDKDRAPVPDTWYYSRDSRAVRRRRFITYIINALKFRDKFGFVGKNPHSTGPIKPKLDSWPWLLENFDSGDRRSSPIPFLYIREKVWNKFAKKQAGRDRLVRTFNEMKRRAEEDV